MNLAYTDENGVELGYLPSYTLDLAYGDDENDFEVELTYGTSLARKSYVFVDGTEWGGIVRGARHSTIGEHPVSYATGRTWHGMLAESIVCPDPGQDYVSVDMEANAAIGWLIERQGLSGVFDVSEEDTGTRVSYRFGRYTDVYASMRGMLKSVGMKLKIDKPPGCKPVLYAADVRRYVDEISSSRLAYKLADDTPYNHIVCLGKGELAERAVVHLYADVDGVISSKQTLFGLDERTYRYELSSAEADELAREGAAKLAELQNTSGIDLCAPDDEVFDVGDIVGISDEQSGDEVTADVVETVVKVSSDGVLVVTNEIGAAVRRTAQTAASPSGVVAYRAGANIAIDGSVISAEMEAIPVSFIESL